MHGCAGPMGAYPFMTMTTTGRSISLPPEIWLYIHRLATSDTSPMALAHTDQFQYVPITDPLKDVQNFWRVSSTFVI
jgi:hypothetical protein